MCSIEDGQFRKAIQALTSEGVAEPTSEVKSDMLAKHPQAPPTPIPLGPMPPSPAISGGLVMGKP